MELDADQRRKQQAEAALLKACERGDLAAVRRAIEVDGADPACRDWGRWTLLHYTSYYNHEPIVGHLLSDGRVDPSARRDGPDASSRRSTS